MKQVIVDQLLAINHKFYHDFGDAFAATRRRIQPGIRRILSEIPRDGDWLDLGCGSGALGVEWAMSGMSGSYLGLDFSEPLLKEARSITEKISNEKLSIRCGMADLMDPGWDQPFSDHSFDGVCAFASIHHIPGAIHHQRIMRAISRIIKPGGLFIFSVWQFQNSPKLMNRILPWETVGMELSELEPGDTLLDWRYSLPGQTEQTGLRYVHLFSSAELHRLAEEADFRIEDEFLSDGAEGNLALYLICRSIKKVS